jgi:hypothetical protein
MNKLLKAATTFAIAATLASGLYTSKAEVVSAATQPSWEAAKTNINKPSASDKISVNNFQTQAAWADPQPAVASVTPAMLSTVNSFVTDISITLNLAGNTKYLNMPVRVSLWNSTLTLRWAQRPEATFTGGNQNKTFTFDDVVLLSNSNNIFYFSIEAAGDDDTFDTFDANEDLAVAYYQIKYQSVKIHRFWSDNYKGHFYTTNTAEVTEVKKNPNWKYEGEKYDVIPYNSTSKTCADVNSMPVHRFWSDTYKKHFYSTSSAEVDAVKLNKNWKYEAIVFCAFPEGQATVNPSYFSPIYRFWSDSYKGHFYTSEFGEYQALQTNPNWKFERKAYAIKKNIV